MCGIHVNSQYKSFIKQIEMSYLYVHQTWMLSMLHESCQVNLFNKHIMLELKGFGTIINKLGLKWW